MGFDSLRWLPDEDLRRQFADYAKIGAKWLRTDLNWAVVQEEGPYSFDWSGMDRIVSFARDEGMTVLPVVGNAPPWDWAVPGEPNPPRDIAGYARFLSQAVRRYAPQDIHAWEIWNEPNLAGAWAGPPDPKVYAELLKAAAVAIRLEDPQALVLFGGLSSVRRTGPVSGPVQYYSAAGFLEAVYEAGAGGAFDVLSFHPYSYPDLPDSLTGDSLLGRTGWGLMTGAVRRTMEAAGDGDKPIWVTEFGAPTGGPGSMSEEDQARAMQRAWNAMERAGATGPFLWYAYQDIGIDRDDRESWFGLLRPDGSAKPAYEAFRDLGAAGQ